MLFLPKPNINRWCSKRTSTREYFDWVKEEKMKTYAEVLLKMERAKAKLTEATQKLSQYKEYVQIKEEYLQICRREKKDETKNI